MTSSLDLTDRMSIVQAKAKTIGIEVSEDVIRLIAFQFESNVRDLEGAVVQLIAYSSLKNQDITVELAAEALGVGPAISLPDAGKTPPSATLQDNSNTPNPGKLQRETTVSQQDRRWYFNVEAVVSDKCIKLLHLKPGARGTNILLGLLQGFTWSSISTVFLVLNCILIDYLFHVMRLSNPHIPLLWSLTVGLNLLTVVIPIDFFRLLRRFSMDSLHRKIRLGTFSIVESTIVVVFIAQLLYFKSFDSLLMFTFVH